MNGMVRVQVILCTARWNNMYYVGNLALSLFFWGIRRFAPSACARKARVPNEFGNVALALSLWQRMTICAHESHCHSSLAMLLSRQRDSGNSLGPFLLPPPFWLGHQILHPPDPHPPHPHAHAPH